MRVDMFSDSDVRKGFSYAFDYDTYIRDVYLGEADRCITPIVDTLPYHNPAQAGYDYNLALAQSHLQNAWGGDLWENGFSLTLAYNTGNVARRIASEMTMAAIESLNPKFHIDIASVPWPEYLGELVSFKLTAFVLGWLADYPDPHNFVYPFMHSDGTFSYFQRYSNPIVDALVEDGIATPDGPAREAIYYELQRLYVEDNPGVPLAKPTGRHWERDWIQGWYYNPIYGGSLAVGFGSTAPAAPVLYFYHLWKGYRGDTDKDYDVDMYDVYNVEISLGLSIENAMAMYGVPPGTDIDGDGWIGILDLFSVLFQYQPPMFEKTLNPTSGELGDVVHITLTIEVPSDFTAKVVDTLPREFRYIDGSFTLDGIPATPIVDKNAVSYTITTPGTHMIEFDVKVNDAKAWEDMTVCNVATSTWYLGEMEVEEKEDIECFVIHPFEELSKRVEGELTIKTETETQWNLIIEVTNPFGYTMTDVVITDRFGAEIEIDEPFPYSITHGTVSYTTKGRSQKVFLTWNIGNLLSSETARLILLVSTDINPGQGDCDYDRDVDLNDLYLLLTNYGRLADECPYADMNEDGEIDVSDLYPVLIHYGHTGLGKQEYSEPGIYELNSGATLKFIDPEQNIQLSAYTDSIYVTVLPPEDP